MSTPVLKPQQQTRGSRRVAHKRCHEHWRISYDGVKDTLEVPLFDPLFGPL